MGIDIDAVIIRAGQLKQYLYWLLEARKKLDGYKAQLDSGWIGKDAYYIGLAVDELAAELKKIYMELDEIRLDIIKETENPEWRGEDETQDRDKI